MKPDAYEIHPWVWLDQDNNVVVPIAPLGEVEENRVGLIQEASDEDDPNIAGWGLHEHRTGEGLTCISDHQTKDKATIAMLAQILKRLLTEIDQHSEENCDCKELLTICTIARAEVKARC